MRAKDGLAERLHPDDTIFNSEDTAEVVEGFNCEREDPIAESPSRKCGSIWRSCPTREWQKVDAD
jgi:hypothetical protein